MKKERKSLKRGKYHYYDNENKKEVEQIGKKFRMLKPRRVKIIKQYRKFYFENRPT